MLTETQRNILQDARDLLADPDRWCQETSARDALGRGVAPVEAEAVQWCAEGAMIRAAIQHGGQVSAMGLWVSDELRDLWRALSVRAAELHPDLPVVQEMARIGRGSVAVNDKLGYDALMTLFDKVLADETVA